MLDLSADLEDLTILATMSGQGEPLGSFLKIFVKIIQILKNVAYGGSFWAQEPLPLTFV